MGLLKNLLFRLATNWLSYYSPSPEFGRMIYSLTGPCCGWVCLVSLETACYSVKVIRAPESVVILFDSKSLAPDVELPAPATTLHFLSTFDK
jgi:hypothetical protein